MLLSACLDMKFPSPIQFDTFLCVYKKYRIGLTFKEDEKWMAQTRDHTAPFSHTTYCIISLCFLDPQKTWSCYCFESYIFDWNFVKKYRKTRNWIIIFAQKPSRVWKCATFFCFKSIPFTKKGRFEPSFCSCHSDMLSIIK